MFETVLVLGHDSFHVKVAQRAALILLACSGCASDARNPSAPLLTLAVERTASFVTVDVTHAATGYPLLTIMTVCDIETTGAVESPVPGAENDVELTGAVAVRRVDAPGSLQMRIASFPAKAIVEVVLARAASTLTYRDSTVLGGGGVVAEQHLRASDADSSEWQLLVADDPVAKDMVSARALPPLPTNSYQRCIILARDIAGRARSRGP